jgi:hypothetical protein
MSILAKYHHILKKIVLVVFIVLTTVARIVGQSEREIVAEDKFKHFVIRTQICDFFQTNGH